MSNKERIEVALKELIEQQNSDAIKKYFSPDYIAHAENKQYKGHPFLKQFSKTLQKSFPQIRILKVIFLLEDENTITWQRTLQGIHQSNMMGIPASKKLITWNEMVVSRFEKDLIIEEWVVSELLGQLLLKLPKTKKVK